MLDWIAARRGKSWLVGFTGGPTQIVVSPPPGFPGAGEDEWFDQRVAEMVAGLNDAQRTTEEVADAE